MRAGSMGVYFHFRKANEFLGMRPLPYFVCYDVIKIPDVPRDLKEYEAHLEKVFKNIK